MYYIDGGNNIVIEVAWSRLSVRKAVFAFIFANCKDIIPYLIDCERRECTSKLVSSNNMKMAFVST
jgi:hypothetical protein